MTAAVIADDLDLTELLRQPFRVLNPEGQPAPVDGTVPQCPVALTRISDAKGEEKGVNRQENRLLALNARLGWGPLTIVVENDISGYKRRKTGRLNPDGSPEYRVFRPGLRQIMTWLWKAQHDGFVVLDIDRLGRDPYDYEDFAQVVRRAEPPIPCQSVTGSLGDPRTGAGLTMGRVMTAMANGSSEGTARRVADARLDIAMAGKWGGGRRPFGFGVEVDHPLKPGVILLDVTQQRPDEAARVAKGYRDVLAGVSLREQVKALNVDKVSTVAGKRWTSLAWRDILLRPRNAGLVQHQGKILEGAVLAGVDAEHPPIVDQATWEAVCAILTSPHRRTSPGPTPRWLGTGIYRCGHPECLALDKQPTLRVGTGAGSRPGRRPSYGCARKAHMRRQAVAMDAFVEDMVVARLASPDAMSLLTPKVRVDTVALNAEAAKLRAILTNLDDALEAGVMKLVSYSARSKRVQGQLDDVLAKLNAACGVDPLAGVAGNPDVKGIWAGLPLARRRAIVRHLVTVTVGPASKARPGWKPGKGANYFSTEGIVLDWHTFG